jgi:hypothetical protein
MAEQRINLNNFKSSGVYTVEIDQSENVVLPLTTGRLVVGSSRVGPFNTVVLINDLRTLKAVYGEIDPKLEKAGGYFHRSIEVALREGPVYALNVVPLDDALDLGYFTTFNTEAASNNDIATVPTTSAIANFFNKQRFWIADFEQLNKYKNLELGDDYITNPGGLGTITSEANKVLSFVNLGSSNATIWVRKASVTGFDLTAKEWYSTVAGAETEFPAFVHPDDFISDYFVEVIAVNGEWSNYLKLSKDPVYKVYFDEAGLKANRAADFFALREITVISRTVGCLIPDFRDQRGQTVAIDRLVNRLFPTTGILCALDVKKLDLIDLTEGTFVDSDVHSHRIDIVGHGYDDLNGANGYAADDGGYDVDDSVADLTPLIDTISYAKPADADLIFKINNNPSVNGNLQEADFLAGFQDAGLTIPAAQGEAYLVAPAVGDSYLVAMQGSALYNAYAKGFMKTGDVVSDGTNQFWLKVVDSNFSITVTGPLVIPYVKIQIFQDITLSNQEDFDITTEYGAYTGPDTEDYFKVTLDTGANFKHTFDLTTDFTSYDVQQPNVLVLGIDTTSPSNKDLVDEFIKVNQYIKAKTTSGRTRLLKIISIQSTEVLSPYSLTYKVTTMAPSTEEVIGIDDTNAEIQVYKGIYNFVTSLKGQYLKGFKIRNNSLPDGTAERQDTILSYLFESTAIPQALANGELVDFRYVVDTYEGQISSNSKYYLAKIAAMNGQAMALLNTPSMQQFEKSVSPSFINSVTKLVSTEYISQGGDLSLNPEYLFKFAEEDVNGVPLSSYATYYFPNLIIRSGTKNISVPPAAYISNLYVRKFKNGTPFLIVAGGKRGAVTDPEIVGLEYDLTDDDRDFLEPVGHNLIVKRRGFGIILFSNNTAYQRINSALNNAHIRDNLSTIERDIEKILFNFLFDFNDEITRLRVKTIVQNYLDAVVSARGLSSYSIVFDSSNNTNEVISANTAIIDIKVDFPRGIHKFINRITITRVGGQLSSESTGFIPSF